MQTRAAILWEKNSEWSVEDIELDDPKAGEVKVKLAASGLCHSDEHMVTGDMVIDQEIADLMGWKQFPVIGGHEGAGEIVEVGPGVTSVKEGDHVVLSFIPACGRCPSCAQGRQHICDLGAFLLSGRQISDMTSRHHSKNGEDLGTMCCTGTFEPYTVVNESSVIKIDDWIPLDKAALVGCGVTTGWGSAVNAAGVQAGDTVVVIGIGGIGMNAVQGAAMAGARHVIAVDPVEWKREKAISTFGATHGAASIEEAQAMVAEMTWGANADKVILTVGTATGDLIGPMMGMVTKGGRGVVTAVAPVMQEDVKLNLFDMAMQRKELVGCIFGNANPRRDVTRLLRLYEEGKLKLDELITNTYTLDEVNQGYQDMRDGKNIRGLITY
ncbi:MULTISPECIES: NDMA-dependent alcohol dehydrogenase [Actinomadura]|uniref:Alcohol dehydrogenase GroES domain-containing protein n=2 Tax=Actinomadura TaxID=1988 RepID=A0A7D3VQE8_ACTVE|nr:MULTISPECIES: NDMA-dependent alcohol dehydrogenase [Actinomadura]MBO2464748.1 NDMA-dependent alcohol dehydrogenase [Actinomadura violacea]QKG20318.1 alcohol dehydrogenase GroES domain-containing protein [Actinomadura verrucosospora]